MLLVHLTASSPVLLLLSTLNCAIALCLHTWYNVKGPLHQHGNVSLQEQDANMWQPKNWVQLLQPIVAFLQQIVQRFNCNTEEQLSGLYTTALSLQQSAEKFHKLERCPGERIIMIDLGNLVRSARTYVLS